MQLSGPNVGIDNCQSTWNQHAKSEWSWSLLSFDISQGKRPSGNGNVPCSSYHLHGNLLRHLTIFADIGLSTADGRYFPSGFGMTQTFWMQLIGFKNAFLLFKRSKKYKIVLKIKMDYDMQMILISKDLIWNFNRLKPVQRPTRYQTQTNRPFFMSI